MNNQKDTGRLTSLDKVMMVLIPIVWIAWGIWIIVTNPPYVPKFFFIMAWLLCIFEMTLNKLKAFLLDRDMAKLKTMLLDLEEFDEESDEMVHRIIEFDKNMENLKELIDELGITEEDLEEEED